MKTDWGSGCIAPRILNLGTGWMWIVSFTHALLRSSSPRTDWLERTWAPEQVWKRWRMKKKLHHCLRQELNIGHQVRTLVSILT